jgi:hypothetical protein
MSFPPASLKKPSGRVENGSGSMRFIVTRLGAIGLILCVRIARSPIGSMRTGHTLIAARDRVVITYHIPTEFERFQARIGRLSLDDVSGIVSGNRTRELYSQTEGTIALFFPKKDHSGVN